MLPRPKYQSIDPPSRDRQSSNEQYQLSKDHIWEAQSNVDGARTIRAGQVWASELHLPEPAIPLPPASSRSLSESDTAFSPIYETHSNTDGSFAFSPLPEENESILVRCPREGTGGTFAFKNPAIVTDEPGQSHLQRGTLHAHPCTQFVGVKECWTRAGVYFQIGEDRFFCASVDIDTSDPSGGWSVPDRATMTKIGQVVRVKFQELSAAQHWSPSDVKADTVILVGANTHHTLSGGLAGPGAGVVVGVLNFLGLRFDDVKFDFEAHGFAVKPGVTHSAMTMKFDRDPGAHNPYFDLPGYVLCDDQSLSWAEWTYLMADGEWLALWDGGGI